MNNRKVQPELVEIRTGRPALLAGQLTAYGKQRRDGPVFAARLGLEGDAVANQRVHGGPEKAVYAYSLDQYAAWRESHPQHAERLVPGGFGENLVIAGLTETDVQTGDRWRIGEALVEVCQPRQPCNTLARWFDDAKMVKAMVQNGRCGWYLRVVEEGPMQAGDHPVLEHRPRFGWTIARVVQASYRRPPDRAEMIELSQAPGLASGWPEWAGKTAMAEKPGPKPL